MIEKKISKVNINNDSEMVSLCMRNPMYISPDFSKSSEEKAKLQRERRIHKENFSGNWGGNKKDLSDTVKLVITLKKSNFPNTVYSHVCLRSSISNVLSKYVDGKGNSVISKYTINGKMYS